MKKKILKLFILLFMIICFIGVCYYFYKIFAWKKDVTENKVIHEEIIKFVNKDEEEKEESKNKYNIDFTSLKKSNSDTVAYLKVNNTNIDHIVVKGKDNDYYLHHNFNKK